MCEAISPATSLPDVSALTEEVGEVVSRHLATNPLLVWAHRPRNEIEALPAEEISTVKESVRFMSSLMDRGIWFRCTRRPQLKSACVQTTNAFATGNGTLIGNRFIPDVRSECSEYSQPSRIE